MAKKKKLRVALIFGGTSKEREVSLISGRNVARYLHPKKYDIVPVEISKVGKWLTTSEMIKQIGKEIATKPALSSKEIVPISESDQGKIDVAFLALHGPGGEDGTVQSMLELLKIPYTCSGVLASALAMDKVWTKRFLAGNGIKVLPEFLVKKAEFKKSYKKILKKIHGKVVIKPNKMGSSIGVTISANKKEIKKGIEEAFKHDDEILIEPFIKGREITVPVLGNNNPVPLPVVEIIPLKSDFFDFKAKYDPGASDEVVPAPISKKLTKEAQKLAVMIHKLLGCRGMTRSDFILGKDDKFYFLEINTIPGMTPNSLVPKSAQVAGITFPKLLDKLIELAIDKD